MAKRNIEQKEYGTQGFTQEGKLGEGDTRAKNNDYREWSGLIPRGNENNKLK